MRSMSNDRLTPTAYLILGLIAREGPSTPYDLERHVEVTLGNLWSFAHTLFYSEPPRLAAQGLLTETRDPEGRRRRVFGITPSGLAALTAWLDEPSDEPTELRDLGLLQLFLIDLAPPESRLRLAQQQLVRHTARLGAYQANEPRGRRPRALRGQRTVEHWRAEAVHMGLLYERAAVEFWTGVLADAGATTEGQPGSVEARLVHADGVGE